MSSEHNRPPVGGPRPEPQSQRLTAAMPSQRSGASKTLDNVPASLSLIGRQEACKAAAPANQAIFGPSGMLMQFIHLGMPLSNLLKARIFASFVLVVMADSWASQVILLGRQSCKDDTTSCGPLCGAPCSCQPLRFWLISIVDSHH